MVQLLLPNFIYSIKKEKKEKKKKKKKKKNRILEN